MMIDVNSHGDDAQRSGSSGAGHRIRSALLVDAENVFHGLNTVTPGAGRVFAADPALWLGWLSVLEYPAVAGAGGRDILVRDCFLNPSLGAPWRAAFVGAGFRVVDCPPLTNAGKNAADIQLVVTMMDLLHERGTRYDEFIVMSNDSDFIPVLRRARHADRRTVVVTAGPYGPALAGNCDHLVQATQFIHEALGPAASSLPARTTAPSRSDRPIDACSGPEIAVSRADHKQQDQDPHKAPTAGADKSVDDRDSRPLRGDLLVPQTSPSRPQRQKHDPAGDTRYGQEPADRLIDLTLLEALEDFDPERWSQHHGLLVPITTTPPSPNSTVCARPERGVDSIATTRKLANRPSAASGAHRAQKTRTATTAAQAAKNGASTRGPAAREAVAARVIEIVGYSAKPVLLAVLGTPVRRILDQHGVKGYDGVATLGKLLAQLPLNGLKVSDKPPGHVYDPTRHATP